MIRLDLTPEEISQLESIRRRLPEMVATAGRLADEDIGTATSGAMLASCWHETQYTRLFRS